MTTALHQITMSYSAGEDRLLMRISTAAKSEYQFWLTRRFVGVLWPALMAVIEKEDPEAKRTLMPAAKKAVMAMKHSEVIAASDFTRAHDEGAKQLTPGPLLVIGGSVIPGKPGKKGITVLIFKTQGKRRGAAKAATGTQTGAEIKISLDKTLLHALCRLLIETTMKADWGLGLAVGDPASVMVPEDKARIH